MHHAGNSRIVEYPDLKRFGLIIADIVDAKSHFTKEHSIGVARLSRYLAGLAGISGERLGEIEIAGLLHDIGKLQVPDEVLESPASLSPAERAVIMKHSFATWRILRRIGGLGNVARWASEHHESIGGAGLSVSLCGGVIGELTAGWRRGAGIFGTGRIPQPAVPTRRSRPAGRGVHKP